MQGSFSVTSFQIVFLDHSQESVFQIVCGVAHLGGLALGGGYRPGGHRGRPGADRPGGHGYPLRDLPVPDFGEEGPRILDCQKTIKLKVNYATSGGQRGDITEIGEYNILK